jgi:hypothetical protein
MRRRKFMKAAGLMAAAPICNSIAQSPQGQPNASKEIYEWRIYNLKADGSALDKYYAEALIPAYNRQGIEVGAFAPEQASDTPQRYYLFIYPNLAKYGAVQAALWNDQTFRAAAQPFFDLTAPNPAYNDFTSYLCEAFDKVPRRLKPATGRTLFEWRNYKSPNEEANKRKVKMFNSGEIDIFDKSGINSVCYGDVIAGPRMPSLIYLTWYVDRPARDEAWRKFVAHPDWHSLRDMAEYRHTATDNQSVLLKPLDYSQI